jgi:RND family efflux transporter MFP subunit
MENETASGQTSSRSSFRRAILMITVSLILVFSFALILLRGRDAGQQAGAENKPTEEHKEGKGNEVSLSPEALKTAGLEIAEVILRPGGSRLRVAGTVEANQQQTEHATPLVSGRIERVNVALGDRVRAGAVLAVISSPQIAQMHGKLHEAETKLALAEREFSRVLKAENRAAVLSAKAKLNEAEATLNRTRRLIELGAGAGRDLIAAETAYQTAKAEYEYQSTIAINREVQEVDAAVQTARVDVAHIRDEMRSLGAPVPVRQTEREDHQHNTSLINLLSPVSGAVIERKVNAGAGIEAGQSLFTIANLSTVWVIANVPEAQVSSLRAGSAAEIRASALGNQTLTGRVSYIAPQLNEETRTARVRIEVSNPGERLKAGMFADVEFQMLGAAASPPELVVPEEAIQRIGERTVVFIPEEEEGHFKVRNVEVGATTDGLRRILSGLEAGEKVVTKGSFTLKTQLLKGELGEGHH